MHPAHDITRGLNVPCTDAPDLWFPRSITRAAHLPAKTLCRSCPVITECLEVALDNSEEYGVWGGTDPTDRRRLLRRRAAGTAA